MTSLLLEIAQHDLPILANQKTKSFEQLGGTIGRASNNDWVLSDAKCHISSLHAEIEYADSAYYLKDVSTNGVFIDGNSVPLGRGNRIQIHDKMRLTIGDYEIDAILSPSSALQTGANPVEHQGDLSSFFSSTESSPIENLLSTPALDRSIAPTSEKNVDSNAIDPLKALLGDEPIDNMPLDPQTDKLHSDKPYQPPYSEHVDGGHFTDSVFTDSHNTDQSQNPNNDASSNTKETQPLEVFSIPDNWDKTEWDSEELKGSNPTPLAASQPKEQTSNEGLQDVDLNHPWLNPTSLPGPQPDSQTNDDNLILNNDAQVEPSSEHPLETQAAAPPVVFNTVNTSAKPINDSKDTHNTDTENNTGITPNTNQSSNENRAIINMLQAMGVDTTDLDSETIATQWINMMPIILDGLIKMLHIRGEIKSQFRAEQTTMRVTENNPLKFSSDASMAIHNLFIRPLQGFQGPEAAMAEVLHDLAVHQQAMTAGLQSGFEEFISRLSPEAIDQKINRISGDSKGFLNKIVGAKHWPVYVETYNTAMKGSNDSFLKLFGNRFVRTYEEYLRDNRYQANNDNNSNKSV